MKRTSCVALGLILISLVAVRPALAQDDGTAQETRFAVGIYGIYQWAVAQDDAQPGGFFGGKAKYRVLPQLDIEPNISWVKSGDGETDSGGTIPAPDIVAYQLNANFHLIEDLLQLTGGIGWASVDVGIGDSTNKFAGNFGLEVEIPVGPLVIDVSPRVLVIKTESGASRKFVALMAGLNFRF